MDTAQRSAPRVIRRLLARAAAGLLLAISVVAPGAAMGQSGEAGSDAVILIYHRFGEEDIPLTNIRVDQFEAHLEELEKEQYSVLPLARILEALKSGEPLPDRAVAITVDDAYSSFAEVGWPMLEERGFPVTLFVATDAVDAGYRGILGWDEIRRLKSEGVAIGHHGAAHLHMVDAGPEAAREDIAKASRRFEDELGEVPPIFAYPYGEYSLALEEIVQELGFAGALAQYSGVAAKSEGLYSLPRFPFNESYGDIGDFRLKVNAMALPVGEMIPRGPVIGENDPNPPVVGFTVTHSTPPLERMTCYPSHTGPAELRVLASKRVELRVDAPFPPGRSRINCTLRDPSGRWFWQGKLFYVPGTPSD